MIGISLEPIARETLPVMPKKSNRQRRYPDWENTCNYCLYLQKVPRSPASGNCTYHREWIPRSAFSTCSDMSAQPLEEGIYTLSTSTFGTWTYHRRRDRVRTHLFLVPGTTPDTATSDTEKQPRTKKRMT